MTKRRRFFSFLINEPPQRYFVGMQFFMLSAILLFLLYGSFELFHQFSLSAASGDTSPEQLKLQLKSLYASLFMRLLVIFLTGFFMNAFFGLIFLHRVTGPLQRVKRILNDLADGRLPPEGKIQFRRGDFTPELASALNRLCEFMNHNRMVSKQK